MRCEKALVICFIPVFRVSASALHWLPECTFLNWHDEFFPCHIEVLYFLHKPVVTFSGEICKKVWVSIIRGRYWDQRARQMLLDVIIAQTETDLQHRNPDLPRATGFYGLELAQCPDVWGWVLYGLANHRVCLIICVSPPMRSNSNWRSILPMTLLPYLPGICCWESWQVTQLQQLCEIFWLQDHREVTRKHQKWKMVRRRLDDWALCIVSLCLYHRVETLVLLLPVEWQWNEGLEPSPVSLRGDSNPAHSHAWSFCLQIPI
jgi:hypothetical protein